MSNPDLAAQLAEHSIEKLKELERTLPKGTVYYAALQKALLIKQGQI